MYVCLNCGTETGAEHDGTCQSCGGPIVTMRQGAVGDSYSGRVLGNKYVLLKPLGRGGMGAVYKARHRSLDKVVAVKILDVHFQEKPSALKRFYAEARNAARLEHPNNIKVFDFGHEDDGLAYIVMELARGRPLSRLTLPIPVERGLRIMLQVCAALQEAHDLGLVHRDLKPDNIMLSEVDGADFSRVLDYGIAKSADSSTVVTRTGTIVGTPQYISPEQATGDEVDHRSDIYSLGAVAFELVAGRPPFKAESAMGYAYAHANHPPPRPSELATVAPEVEQLILDCLAKRPEDRPASMDAVRGRIEAILGEQPVSKPSGELKAVRKAALRSRPTVEEEEKPPTVSERPAKPRTLVEPGTRDTSLDVAGDNAQDGAEDVGAPVSSGELVLPSLLTRRRVMRWAVPAFVVAAGLAIVLALGPFGGGGPEGGRPSGSAGATPATAAPVAASAAPAQTVAAAPTAAQIPGSTSPDQAIAPAEAPPEATPADEGPVQALGQASQAVGAALTAGSTTAGAHGAIEEVVQDAQTANQGTESPPQSPTPASAEATAAPAAEPDASTHRHAGEPARPSSARRDRRHHSAGASAGGEESSSGSTAASAEAAANSSAPAADSSAPAADSSAPAADSSAPAADSSAPAADSTAPQAPAEENDPVLQRLRHLTDGLSEP